MKKFVLAALVVSSSVFAHDGPHGPSQKVAPHGGILRDGTALMFELVKDGQDIKIYPIEFDGKAVELKEVSIDLKKTTLTDSKKKPVKFTLDPSGDFFVLKFEAGSSHRYAFHLVAQNDGKGNKADWQIELGSE